MSSLYSIEPSTSGKVVLKTSTGDFEVELWAKETPLACRNFIQLCLEGYFDGTFFFRIVPGFLIQGGDRSGTGEGGESVFGETFKDEFNSRLKFTHRGLLACASANKRNSNTSQFFITLRDAPELDGKHTIFGKVVGNTIFNVLRAGECEVVGDRPLNAPKIHSVDVIVNPFEDIVPRDIFRVKGKVNEVKKKKVKKNLSLLSFQTDDTPRTPLLKVKSILGMSRDSELHKDASFKESAISAPSENTEKRILPLKVETQITTEQPQKPSDEYESIKQSLLQLASRHPQHPIQTKPSVTEERHSKYNKGKAKSKRDREAETLAKLHQFKQMLSSESGDHDWKSHRLEFKKRPQDHSTGDSISDFVVIDPREKKRKQER